MNKITIFLVLIFLSVSVVFSQPAVISEYYNASGPNSEWTEILVTSDNISMVGYSIRDNSRNEGWQGGVKFKNHSLWKNLREGTIIIINHRGTAADDVDKSDGFIEVDAENSTYFEKFMTSVGGLPWEQRAMNLNGGHDMIQLRDENDVNVHTLAHIDASSQPSIDFNNLNSSKLARNGGVNNSTSVRVVPGRSLSDYKRGFDNSNSYTVNDADDSKGFPNQSSSSTTDNSNFWRKIRQPYWQSSTNLNATVTQNSVDLSWTPAMSDNDEVQGYLLLRIPDNQLSQADDPVDGQIYSPGDQLGSAVVVDNITKLSTSSYSDVSSFNCGNSYVYRLYIYRYNQSNKPSVDNDPENARGRSYNEDDFAESASVTKEAPPRAQLFTDGDIKDFCDNEDIILKVSNFDEIKDYDFVWEKNNQDISDEKTDELNISQYGSGNYKLVIYSDNGCYSESLIMNISIIKTPDARIADDKLKEFTKNDTLKICEGDEVVLQSISKNDEELIWMKDNDLFDVSNAQQVSVSEAGTYKLVAINQNLCKDTSYTVTIEYIDIDFVVTPDPLIIDADVNDEGTMTITNNSDEPLNITMINLPTGFTRVSPSMPMTIGANQSVNVVIKYTPQKYGDYQDILVVFDGCGGRTIVDIIGKKMNDNETVVNFTPPNGFDFAVVSNCHVEGYDSLYISVIGDKKTTLYSPNIPIDGITLVHNYSFPMTLKPNEPIAIGVELTKVEGYYSGNIEFDYEIEGDGIKTLSIPYEGEVVAPNLTYESLEYDFLNIPECEESVDSVIVATNNTKIQIILEDQPVNPNVRFNNLPIVFEPGETHNIEFTYTPMTSNDEFNTAFWTFPCKDVQEIIKIIGIKVGVNVVPETSNVNFLAVKGCELEDGAISMNSDIKIEGGEITITSIDLPDPNIYTVSGISIGDVLDSDVTLTYTFTPPYSNTFRDSIVIRYEPCDVKKVINITGRFINTEFTVQPETLNFGYVDVGNESGERTFTITNTGEEELVIDGFANLQTPYIMTAPSVADFPVIISPSEMKDFTFKYQPQTPANDTIDLELNITEPCVLKQNVRFNGASGREKSANLKVFVPQDVQLEASKNGFIPVKFSFGESIDHIAIQFDTIALTMKYDPTVIFPQGVFAGPSLNEEGTELYLDEINPGELFVKITFLDDSTINSGEVLKINTKGLVGEATSTDITFDKVDYNTHNDYDINIETEGGVVQIIGECDLDNRLISLDGAVGMILPSGNILTSNSEVQINVATTDLTDVRLYDINGNNVNTLLSKSIQPGSYNLNLNIEDINSGVYYLVMKSGISTKVEKIIIVK